MAQKTKQALLVENNSSFPNNTTGYITPTILRDFNTDIIDSLTTQIEFNENSDAVNNSLASLNAFTASAEGLNTGSLLITASFNNGTRNLLFTKGDTSQFSVNIPDASGSELPTGLVSGSSQIDVTQTENYSGINQYSDGKVLTYINTQGVVSGSVLRTLPAGTVSSSAQISELGYATTQSLNSFTQSVDDKFTNIGNQSGSWDDVTDITALNTFTQSQEDKNSTLASYTGSNDTKWNTLGGQSGSFVTEAETASFARVDVQNVFTQTQTINADLFVSGTINAYQINTTIESSSVIYSSGSNQFGDELSDVQTLSGSVKVVGELTLNGVGVLTASADISALNSFTSSQEAKNNTLGGVTQSLQEQLTNIGSQSGSWDDVTDITALNTFTASQETKNNTLGSYTASVDNSLTALNTYTGSNDTKWNNIASQSGSWDTTADITALNTFTASQEAKDSTLGAWTGSIDDKFNTIGSQSGSWGSGGTLPAGLLSSSVTNFTDYSASVDSRIESIVSGTGFATTGSNTFNGDQNIIGTITASILEGYVLAGGASNISTLVATSSFGGGGGDLTSLNQYTASNDTKWSTLGGETGSYAIKSAVNTFTDVNQFNSTSSFFNTLKLNNNIFGASNFIELNVASSSVTLASPAAANGISGLAHLQSSNPSTQINLMLKDNNNTATTIVSGSNNLFVNPAAATAEFNRYIGNGNIALNSGNVPQISGSMGYSPNVNNNYFGGNGTTLNMRGPVSSTGTWTIGGNAVLGTVNIGSSAVNHAQGLSAGVSLTLNVIPGTLSVIANQSALTTAPNLTQNYIGGGSNILLRSSSVTLANNTIVDAAFNYTNEFYSSSVGLGTTQVLRNISFGLGNAITVFGTLPAGTVTTPTITDNAMIGAGNLIYVDSTNARTNGTAAYNGAQRNILLGQGLILSGSNLVTDTTSLGSVTVGRWNANDGIRNKSSDTVFAVGTGTSTSVRKTGFLVDSGSNTFVEGTLNVSGSTTFKGSISDTVTVLSITSLTASLDASVGNTFQLSLVDATNTRLEVSNARAGQTLNLLVSQSVGGTGTLSFGSNLYESSGSFYSASVVANAKDIITLATFVETNVIYVANIKNLIL